VPAPKRSRLFRSRVRALAAESDYKREVDAAAGGDEPMTR
jgi:hypothetical protein